MSSMAVVRMQVDLNRLKAERDLIEQEIDQLTTAIAMVTKYASDDEKAELAAHMSLRKTVSKREQIFQSVLEILSDGKARHTADLMQELTARGIEIGGDNKEANLSAYLSRAKAVIGLYADRRYGWSIKKQTPEGVGAPTGAGDLI